jgi:hypothetical protein
VLARCLGESPPFEGETAWEECFTEATELYLEVGLPAPNGYKHWLATNVLDRHFIPYVLGAAEDRKKKGSGWRGARMWTPC